MVFIREFLLNSLLYLSETSFFTFKEKSPSGLSSIKANWP